MKKTKFVPECSSFEKLQALAPSDAWWIGGSTTGSTDCLPGDTLFLHGNNIKNPLWIYLSGAQKGFLSTQFIKPGMVGVLAPHWPLGQYDVWINNEGAWWKFPVPINITTKKALGFDFDSNVVNLNPPSGGDDYAYLQGVCNNLNGALDPTGGPANTLVLQAGTYHISKPLSLLGHYGSHVYLKGQGKASTFIKPTSDFAIDGNSFFIGNGKQVSDLTADARGANLSDTPAFRIVRWMNCDIFSDPIVNCVFMDGNDGPANLYMTGCNVVGHGAFANGLKSAFIDNCHFFLDGSTESAMFFWNANNLHVTNTTARNWGAYNGQRGRIFCLAYNCSNIYLENLQTFSLAGTAADNNCGEQILCDGDPTQHSLSRMYVYNCKLQGRTDAYQWDGTATGQIGGASCGIETWLPCYELHVNGLTVDSAISGLNFFYSDPTCMFENIKITNCRIGFRSFGITTLNNLTATGTINRSMDLNAVTVLNNSVLLDAPVALWSQGGIGSLLLNNSRIYRGTAPLSGSIGVDPTVKSPVTLKGYSCVASFQKANVLLPFPTPPLLTVE